MARSKALVNKLKRRNRFLNRKKDKVNKQDNVLAKSDKAFGLMKKLERRLDSKLGIQLLPSPDKRLLEKLVIVSDLDRFDFDNPNMDYGLRLRMDQVLAGVMEETEITCIADTGAFEMFTVTAPSGGAAAQADYIVFTDPAGETWAVWLDIDGAGTPPTGATYLAADNQLPVSILSSDTNIQVAGKVVAALSALMDMTVTDNLDGTFTIESDLLGDLTDAEAYEADGTQAAPTMTVVVDQDGAASNLQSTSFRLNSPTQKYVVWLNVNNEGMQPSLAEAVTYIEVPLAGGETDAQVATALAGVLDAYSSGNVFDAASALEVVTVSNDADGSAVDAADIDSGFSFAVTAQGVDAQNYRSFKSLGVQAGDVIQILSGDLIKRQYEVVALIDDNTLRLEDDSDLSGPDTDVPVKIRFSGSKSSKS